MGFRIKPKGKKKRCGRTDFERFCETAAKLLPQGHALTMRDRSGECTVCLNGEVLHCEYHRGGRGIAIGAVQAPTLVNIANIMHACQLRFEEQESAAAGHVGRA